MYRLLAYIFGRILEGGEIRLRISCVYGVFFGIAISVCAFWGYLAWAGAGCCFVRRAIKGVDQGLHFRGTRNDSYICNQQGVNSGSLVTSRIPMCVLRHGTETRLMLYGKGSSNGICLYPHSQRWSIPRTPVYLEQIRLLMR
jgi:hypothetical protein